MAKSAEEVARELDQVMVTPEYTDEKGLAVMAEIVRRDRREQAQAVLPLVKWIVAILKTNEWFSTNAPTERAYSLKQPEAWLKSVEEAEHD